VSEAGDFSTAELAESAERMLRQAGYSAVDALARQVAMNMASGQTHLPPPVVAALLPYQEPGHAVRIVVMLETGRLEAPLPEGQVLQ
jgi:hypothetical protein